MTNRKQPVELTDDMLEQITGGASCQNNLKQLGLALHNYDTSRSTGGANFAFGDGSVRSISN